VFVIFFFHRVCYILFFLSVFSFIKSIHEVLNWSCSSEYEALSTSNCHMFNSQKGEQGEGPCKKVIFQGRGTYLYEPTAWHIQPECCSESCFCWISSLQTQIWSIFF
jgi:hypothetical protein